MLQGGGWGYLQVGSVKVLLKSIVPHTTHARILHLFTRCPSRNLQQKIQRWQRQQQKLKLQKKKPNMLTNNRKISETIEKRSQ
jgi:hypothetical protein